MVGSKLLRALAEAQIITVFLPGRGASGSAYLHGELGAPVKAHLQQYACYQHIPTRLRIAHYLVSEKIAAQAKHLEQRNLAVPKSLHRPEDTNISDLATLMGIEGAAAAAYFATLAQDIDSIWRFTGRNRRPPRDPVNALLSLSYTLLLANMRHAILGAGLDPLLGFLHQIYPQRESLALDLIEPLRANADAFVLQLLDTFSPDDFHTHADTGCRLNKHVRGYFYQAWADQCTQWQDDFSLSSICRQQTEKLRHQLEQHDGQITTTSP